MDNNKPNWQNPTSFCKNIFTKKQNIAFYIYPGLKKTGFTFDARQNSGF